MSDQQNEQELEKKVLQLVQEAIERDEALRKQYDMENKFRFVRERLQTIFQKLKEELASVVKKTDEHIQKSGLLDNEIIVYVYLYNARGVVLSSWQNLLTPKAFYEYSVNRPIYVEETHIQTLVRSKTNKAQHAYLTIVVKAEHILQPEVTGKDSLGNPLTKVKEGSLSFEKLVCFTTNDEAYRLNDKGELVKKM